MLDYMADALHEHDPNSKTTPQISRSPSPEHMPSRAPSPRSVQPEVWDLSVVHCLCVSRTVASHKLRVDPCSSLFLGS